MITLGFMYYILYSNMEPVSKVSGLGSWALQGSLSLGCRKKSNVPSKPPYRSLGTLIGPRWPQWSMGPSSPYWFG